MDYDSDVLIVGGGLVGASLALALGRAGLRVAVVEAHAFSIDQQPNYDERSIALAQGSQRIFSGLGLWDQLADQVCPIHTIHVSDRGRFGFTRLRREEEDVPALGYVASARVLGNTLIGALEPLAVTELLAPAQLLDFRVNASQVTVELEVDGRSVTRNARLLVAADGAHSSVRERLGIATRQRDYNQTAVIANVTPEREHHNVAYERFTDTGPMALLPMLGDHCALVWTVRSQQAEEILALSDTEFLARLQQRFGNRLGRFQKVGQRHAYRLQLLRARESIRPRLALIGNAVHTLHPVDIGAAAVLERYAAWRQADQRRVVAFTDGMVRIFSQPLPPVAWLRDAGMLALDLCPPAKRWFGRQTMGRAGRLPRLARGLEL
jgi:2-octaprenyl-6-methoxyphenol hydroxylase